MFIGKLNGQSTALNMEAINRSAVNQTNALYGKKKEEDQDTASISPAGQNQSMIELLMKQKEFLKERKESLMDSSLENGSDVTSQLEEYEKQLDDIDNQIAQLQAKQLEETESEDSDGKIYDNPRTKEEARTEQLNGIAALSSDQEQAETVHREKNHIDGAVNVLESEIQSGCGNTEAKSEKVAELESRSQNLSDRAGQKLEDVLEAIDEVVDDGNENIETETEEIDGQTAGDGIEPQIQSPLF